MAGCSAGVRQRKLRKRTSAFHVIYQRQYSITLQKLHNREDLMAFLSVLRGLRGEIFWLRLEAAL